MPPGYPGCCTYRLLAADCHDLSLDSRIVGKCVFRFAGFCIYGSPFPYLGQYWMSSSKLEERLLCMSYSDAAKKIMNYHVALSYG